MRVASELTSRTDSTNSGNAGRAAAVRLRSAADSGPSLRDLMDRMGHSRTRAAVIHMHASKGASRAIAAAIDRQLSAAAKKPKGRGRGGASGT
jgi:hypothetical protein